MSSPYIVFVIAREKIVRKTMRLEYGQLLSIFAFSVYVHQLFIHTAIFSMAIFFLIFFSISFEIRVPFNYAIPHQSLFRNKRPMHLFEESRY